MNRVAGGETLACYNRFFPKGQLSFIYMVRAGKIIGNLNLSSKQMTPEDLARVCWPSAVGKRVAAHTGKIWLVRSSLVVEVEDGLWQRQLHGMRRQILANLESLLGHEIVSDLEFRVARDPASPRIQPQRDERRSGPADDADLISDPDLQKIYKAARRKASA